MVFFEIFLSIFWNFTKIYFPREINEWNVVLKGSNHIVSWKEIVHAFAYIVAIFTRLILWILLTWNCRVWLSVFSTAVLNVLFTSVLLYPKIIFLSRNKYKSRRFSWMHGAMYFNAKNHCCFKRLIATFKSLSFLKKIFYKAINFKRWSSWT